MKKAFVFVFLLIIANLLSAQVKIYIHLDTSIHTSFSGRLILLTQNDTTKFIGSDISPQASFALNIQNWQPGQVQVIDDRAETNSIRISDLKPGYYRLAAVIHTEQDTRANTSTPGNGYTRGEFIFHIPDNRIAEKHLYINAIFKERPFRQTEHIKLLKLKSALLSGFHRKEIFLEAAVVLPDNIKPGEKYPVVCVIPGWGGTHYDALAPQMRSRYGMGQGKEKIYVYLNPETQTKWGLHAFVDSDVNGPWGKALVEELIPYLQQNYPAAQTPDSYFVMGQSSGGYGAAWLQMHYPKNFNGCWAVSPDPVDFSNFTGIALYEKDVNAFVDKSGNERGLFLDNGKPLTTIRRMTLDDDFTGPGGQFQSFDAEFGTAGGDGIPKQLYDRKTGRVNPSVVNSWKRYDLGLYLEKNWHKLSADLDGKVHIYAGGDDNFYLNKAVEAFALKAARVHSNAVAEIIPGANHWSIWSADFTKRVQKEIDARIP
jgi:S-formylglutathione hydrolase FrmB